METDVMNKGLLNLVTSRVREERQLNYYHLKKEVIIAYRCARGGTQIEAREAW